MIKEVVKKYTTVGARNAVRNLRSEFQVMRMHLGGVRKAQQYRGQTGLKLHLGCGPNIKPGWVNIDLSDKADVPIDLREPLPFDSNSCSMIYSEHFLEHMGYPEPVLSLLIECLRVLQPGGEFSAGVPDTEWPLLEYAGVSNKGYFKLAKERWHPKWVETKGEHINIHFRNWIMEKGHDHKYAYDYETMAHILAKAGFVDIERREYDPQLDSEVRSLGSLYVKAFKPKA